MKTKLLFTLMLVGLISFPLFNLKAQTTITHNVSQIPVTGSGAGCNDSYNGSSVLENRFYREFDLLNDFGIDSVSRIEAVEFGIDMLANAPAGGYPVTIKLYTVAAPGLPSGALTLIGSTSVALGNQSLTKVSFPVDVYTYIGDVIVMELDVPASLPNQNTIFFIGANKDGQSADGYLASGTCSIVEPTTFADIGFPDAHIIMNLKLGSCKSSSVSDVIKACDSYTWIDGKTYTRSNNTATHLLKNIAGCDSIVTLDLTINNSDNVTDVHTVCNTTFTWIDGETYTASNNSATHTLKNAAGCDSIITLDLTVESLNDAGDDTSISVCKNHAIDLDTLVSPSSVGAWVDYNGFSIGNLVTLPGTQGTYDYKHVVTSVSCPADTAVVQITVDEDCDYLALIDEDLMSLTVYPNPTQGKLIIQNPTNIQDLEIDLLDMNGRIVKIDNSTLSNNASTTFDLDNLDIGVYTLRVYNSYEQRFFKIVKH